MDARDVIADWRRFIAVSREKGQRLISTALVTAWLDEIESALPAAEAAEAKDEALLRRAMDIMRFHCLRCPLDPMNNYSGCEEHLAEYRQVIEDIKTRLVPPAAERAEGERPEKPEPRDGYYLVGYANGDDIEGVYLGRSMDALKQAAAVLVATRQKDPTLALVKHAIAQRDAEDDAEAQRAGGER